MKVVLDSNVLVAALATRGACAELFSRVLAAHEYAVNDQILAEVAKALSGKFRLQVDRVEAALALLRSTALVVVTTPLDVRVCRDPDDDGILALVHAFSARVLITGDEDLLVLHPWSGIPIVRPRDFWPIDRAGGA